MPSIYEPFGYAALEAMASGVPLVATDMGGMAELFAPEHTGRLVPVRARPGTRRRELDLDALYEAQVEFLADPERARRLAANARQTIAERFTNQAMCKHTLACLRDARAAHRATRAEIDTAP
jgi:glycosyltransferase involved in cell wall biosynthesis